MNIGKNIGQIIATELQRVITDHSIFLTVIAAPILYAFFLGSIYLNKDISKIPFGVVDNDQTHMSRELTRLLSASPKIKTTEKLLDAGNGLRELKKMNIQGFIVFPNGLEKDLLKGKDTQVSLFLNTTRFLPSNELNMAVNKIILQEGNKLRLKHFEGKGISIPLALKMIKPIKTNVKAIYNTTNSYGDFLLPALFFIILQQTLLLGMAESISKDREKGLLTRTLTASPKGVINYLVGKPAYYLLLYSAYLLFFTRFIFPAFQLPVKSSIYPIFVISFLFLMCVSMYAMLAGTFIKKQTQALVIIAFSTYPLFLLSGYSWPISSMPVFLRGFAALIPTTPMLEAMRRLYLMGGGWQNVLPQFEHLLLLFGLSLILLTARLYQIKRKSQHYNTEIQTINRSTLPYD